MTMWIINIDLHRTVFGIQISELSLSDRYKCESCSVVSDCLRPHRLYSLWNSPGHNTGVGSYSLLQWIFPTQGSNPGLLPCRWILYQLSHQGSPVLVAQLCPTLWEPMDYSPPCSSVHGILQARAIPFSRGSSPPRD